MRRIWRRLRREKRKKETGQMSAEKRARILQRIKRDNAEIVRRLKDR